MSPAVDPQGVLCGSKLCTCSLLSCSLPRIQLITEQSVLHGGRGREKGWWGSEVSKADVFSEFCLTGICCCRDSPCSYAPGCVGGASLYLLQSKGYLSCRCTVVLPVMVHPPVCMLPREAAGPPPEVSPMG